MQTPKEWPQEIANSYDPIRNLGSGGFASVVLARTKSDEENKKDIPKKVAIKVMGCNNTVGTKDASSLYAKREIELLQQLNHCGIVRLYDSWEPTNPSSSIAGVLVLEYIKGPTVESLLRHGGALSSTFGRVVIAQVMDALSYLHYRGVLHRDIKPDNILGMFVEEGEETGLVSTVSRFLTSILFFSFTFSTVTGALSTDGFIWDNGEEIDPRKNAKTSDEWKRLCHKYKVTILDFGFARALTPEDLEEDPETSHRKSRDSSSKSEKEIIDIDNTLGNENINDSQHSASSLASVSHKMKRVMSTLGNRNYAAPEIVNKVRRRSAWDKKLERRQKRERQCSETTKTISDFVADYSLLVDSYSMGNTIRYMMTGVRPGLSVDEVIRKQQRSAKAKKIVGKLLRLKKSNEHSSNSSRKPIYRSMGDLHGQIYLLIQNLTQTLPNERISIRKARRTVEWISDVLSFQEVTDSKEAAPLYHTLDRVSEEQLQSLYESHYLPLATGIAEDSMQQQQQEIHETSGFCCDNRHSFTKQDQGRTATPRTLEDLDKNLGAILSPINPLPRSNSGSYQQRSRQDEEIMQSHFELPLKHEDYDNDSIVGLELTI